MFFNNIIRIILRDFFCFQDENKSEDEETHLLQCRDPKTKITQNQDSKIKTSQHCDSGTTKTPQHWQMETIKSWHLHPMAFFQRTKKSHQNSKTEKPWHWDSKTKTPQHQDFISFMSLTLPDIVKIAFMRFVRVWD